MDKLYDLISKSTSPFHSVLYAVDELEENGFIKIEMDNEWKLDKNGKYFINIFDSTLVAFTIGEQTSPNLRIASAHTDFPCLKLKPSCEIKENGYSKLNVEIYGGPVFSSWLDRPLSLSGRVCVKSNDVFKPKVIFVDFIKPVIVIPGIAIHLNKEVNKGVELNAQKDMLPITDLTGSDVSENFFMEQLAKETGMKVEDILDYEIYVYQTEKGSKIGFEDNFFSSPRLDNLTSVRACLDGIIKAGENPSGINIIALFDNEEIGSGTKQGAASSIFDMILEKMYKSLGMTRDNLNADISKGMMLSVDVSHCIHPNAPDKNDITNKDILNGGVCIKYSAKQSYASDCVASSIVIGLCENKKIKYQKFVNRSDGTSGSTLGSISSTNIPMKTVDIGVPLLAMHSARELMGVHDMEALTMLIKEFFKTKGLQ